VKASINPDDLHKPVSTLVSLENTANRGGGSCYNFADIEEIKQICLENNLKFHLDGARLFNAMVARGETAKQYGAAFDSISVCLSKGLGSPVGSVLLGNTRFIKKARRIRKVFGGGMRQAGILAAAGLYALQNQVERLQDDHDRAKELAAVLAKKDFVGEILPVETNILIFGVRGRFTAPALAARLAESGIRVIAISPDQIRIVTHLDIQPADLQETIQVIQSL
jgi:threonine aldolase